MTDKALLFTQAEYNEQTFSGLTGNETDFGALSFYDCVFENCSFRETSFRGCTFDECTFTNCDLSLLQVVESTFVTTRFEECNAIGIDWTKAHWSALGAVEPINFQKCAISHSILMGVSLKKSQLSHCVAENVDFSEADLTDADCTHTNFLSSRFNQTNLTRADFRNASNYNIDVKANVITKAHFSLPEAVALLHSFDIILD